MSRLATLSVSKKTYYKKKFFFLAKCTNKYWISLVQIISQQTKTYYNILPTHANIHLYTPTYSILHFPRALPSRTPLGEGLYLTIYPLSCPNKDTIYPNIPQNSLVQSAPLHDRKVCWPQRAKMCFPIPLICALLIIYSRL